MAHLSNRVQLGRPYSVRTAKKFNSYRIESIWGRGSNTFWDNSKVWFQQDDASGHTKYDTFERHFWWTFNIQICSIQLSFTFIEFKGSVLFSLGIFKGISLHKQCCWFTEAQHQYPRRNSRNVTENDLNFRLCEVENGGHF